MNKLLLLLLPTLVLSACGKSAESSMKAFCGDLSAGKWEKALEAFGDAETIKSAMADMSKDAETKPLVQSLFSGSKCTVAGAKDGSVTLKVDAVNAQAVTASVMADSMGLAFMSAFSGAEGEKMMQQALIGKLTTALTAKDAPRVQTQVNVEMKQVEGRWIPVDGEKLLSAISGGIDKMGQ
ncbi:hypothetical protein [Deinococcus aquatilis]|uniref:hypothetical protein n=1 Tax=Deinococcus aquatilis TaxID=519440 RepID=UPI000360A4BE|nr:hypothetical protein [Deinococcus aquatilis]